MTPGAAQPGGSQDVPASVSLPMPRLTSVSRATVFQRQPLRPVSAQPQQQQSDPDWPRTSFVAGRIREELVCVPGTTNVPLSEVLPVLTKLKIKCDNLEQRMTLYETNQVQTQQAGAKNTLDVATLTRQLIQTRATQQDEQRITEEKLKVITGQFKRYTDEMTANLALANATLKDLQTEAVANRRRILASLEAEVAASSGSVPVVAPPVEAPVVVVAPPVEAPVVVAPVVAAGSGVDTGSVVVAPVAAPVVPVPAPVPVPAIAEFVLSFPSPAFSNKALRTLVEFMARYGMNTLLGFMCAFPVLLRSPRDRRVKTVFVVICVPALCGGLKKLFPGKAQKMDDILCSLYRLNPVSWDQIIPDREFTHQIGVFPTKPPTVMTQQYVVLEAAVFIQLLLENHDARKRDRSFVELGHLSTDVLEQVRAEYVQMHNAGKATKTMWCRSGATNANATTKLVWARSAQREVLSLPAVTKYFELVKQLRPSMSIPEGPFHFKGVFPLKNRLLSHAELVALEGADQSAATAATAAATSAVAVPGEARQAERRAREEPETSEDAPASQRQRTA